MTENLKEIKERADILKKKIDKENKKRTSMIFFYTTLCIASVVLGFLNRIDFLKIAVIALLGCITCLIYNEIIHRRIQKLIHNL